MNQGPQPVGLIYEKNQRSKILCYCPFKRVNSILSNFHGQHIISFARAALVVLPEIMIFFRCETLVESVRIRKWI
jgi:hypothetical protein